MAQTAGVADNNTVRIAGAVCEHCAGGSANTAGYGGTGAPGISISLGAFSVISNTTIYIDNATGLDSSGGVGNMLGGYGFVGVVFRGSGASGIVTECSVYILNMQCWGCSGGNTSVQGAGAGLLGVVFFGFEGVFRNFVSIKNVLGFDVYGGTGNIYGGAGMVGIAYYTDNAADIAGNTNSFSGISCTRCSGGNGTLQGGGAAVLGISYHAGNMIMFNTHLFKDISGVHCRGGHRNAYGGSAFLGISMYSSNGQYMDNGHGKHSENQHSMEDIRCTSCYGGNENGGIGASFVGLAYVSDGSLQRALSPQDSYTQKPSANNWHSLKGLQCHHCEP